MGRMKREGMIKKRHYDVKRWIHLLGLNHLT
jgi:hypothetical protein